MQFSDAKIIVFARAPIKGQVKSRLASSTGDELALDIYKDLLRRTFDTVVSANLAPVCCYTTDADHGWLARFKSTGINFLPQSGDDLGQRMYNAFSKELEQASFVLLLGSDCPVLSGKFLDDALTALQEGKDAALVSAEDGGYVLLGLRKNYQRVFQDIDWGTDRVLSQTLSQFEKLGLSWLQLGPLWDVDTLEDYNRWLEYKNVTRKPEI